MKRPIRFILIGVGGGIFVLFLLFILNEISKTWVHNGQRVNLSNIRQISIGCAEYADTFGNGMYPSDLSELFNVELEAFGRVENMDSLFIRHDRSKVPGKPEEVMDWTDWVYIPGHTEKSPPHSIVLFLPPGHHGRMGNSIALVATAAGSARGIKKDEFVTMLNQTLQFLNSRDPDANQTALATQINAPETSRDR